MKRKILFILGLFIFIFKVDMVFATNDFKTELKAEESEFYAGNIVDVKVVISDLARGAKVGNGKFNIDVSGAIESISTDDITFNSENGGATFANTSGYGNGTLATFKCKIKSDAKKGSAVSITLTWDDDDDITNASNTEESLTSNNANLNLTVVDKPTSTSTTPDVSDTSKSNIATLNSIEVNNDTLTLESGKYEYDLNVDYKYDSLNINYIKTDNNSKVEIRDNKLKVGNNKVYIVVTAEDGITSQTYTLNVVRGEENKLTGINYPITMFILFVVGLGIFTILRKKKYFVNV